MRNFKNSMTQTKQDVLYREFCEVLAGNDVPSKKFILVQYMIADSVFSMDAIDNDRALKVDPEKFRKGELMDKYNNHMKTLGK